MKTKLLCWIKFKTLLEKPQQPNQLKPLWFGLVFILKANQTKHRVFYLTITFFTLFVSRVSYFFSRKYPLLGLYNQNSLSYYVIWNLPEFCKLHETILCICRFNKTSLYKLYQRQWAYTNTNIYIIISKKSLYSS